MIDRSRRIFLKTGGATASLCLVGPSAWIEAFSADVREDSSGRLMPVPLGSVAVDRLLHSFRVTAGIPSSATPYKGWEDPTCELRGHFAGGHFLSAVALAAASSGNTGLSSRGDELVSGLAQCQKKMGTGYLSAFPTAWFERLAAGKPVWAPFYTYHKIMAGLLDMHTLTGNTDALQMAEDMGRWAQEFFAAFSTEQRQRMLRTEYGGMNEVLVNLAAANQKERYLD